MVLLLLPPLLLLLLTVAQGVKRPPEPPRDGRDNLRSSQHEQQREHQREQEQEQLSPHRAFESIRPAPRYSPAAAPAPAAAAAAASSPRRYDAPLGEGGGTLDGATVSQQDQIRVKMLAASYVGGGQDFRALFRHYDRDNSARLEWPEFRRAIRRDAKVRRDELSEDELLQVH